MYIHLSIHFIIHLHKFKHYTDFFSFDSIHGLDQITKLCNFAEERQISLKRGWVNTRRLLWWPIWAALRVTMCFDSMRISRFNIVLVNPLILWLQRCTITQCIMFCNDFFAIWGWWMYHYEIISCLLRLTYKQVMNRINPLKNFQSFII